MIKEQMTLVTGKYIILVSVFSSTRAAEKSLASYQEKFPNGIVEASQRCDNGKIYSIKKEF